VVVFFAGDFLAAGFLAAAFFVAVFFVAATCASWFASPTGCRSTSVMDGQKVARAYDLGNIAACRKRNRQSCVACRDCLA
jgi:hypothetical protein